jgi:hypothetical protein
MPQDITEDVFDNTPLDDVYVPEGSVAAYEAAAVWEDFNIRPIIVNVNVDGVTLDEEEVTLDISSPAHQLTATVSPNNATNKTVIWISSNESVATVNSNGLVTPLSAGTTKISVTTIDGNFSDTCTVTVTQSVSNDVRHLNTLKIYPNPTSGIVYVDTDKPVEIEICNTMGVQIMNTKGNRVDLSKYPAGVYIMRADGKTAYIVKR